MSQLKKNFNTMNLFIYCSYEGMGEFFNEGYFVHKKGEPRKISANISPGRVFLGRKNHSVSARGCTKEEKVG
jgi:hypothetical protein